MQVYTPSVGLRPSASPCRARRLSQLGLRPSALNPGTKTTLEFIKSIFPQNPSQNPAFHKNHPFTKSTLEFTTSTPSRNPPSEFHKIHQPWAQNPSHKKWLMYYTVILTEDTIRLRNLAPPPPTRPPRYYRYLTS